MAAPQKRVWTESDIEAAISQYLAETKRLMPQFISLPKGFGFSEENLMYNMFGQQGYLLIAKVPLHELPVPFLRRLPVYLLRQFEIQVELDSLFYWALTHDVFRHIPVSARWQLQSSFDCLMAAVNAHLGQAPTTLEISKLNTILHEVVPVPVQDLVTARTTLAMYLSYPIVEGLTKRHLQDYVELDGTVKKPITSAGDSFSVGDRPISSLGRLLRMLETSAGPILNNADLGRNLADMRKEIEAIGGRSGISFGTDPKDAWDWIFSLRNDLLHGATPSPLRSGLLTHLVCTLLWHSAKDSDLGSSLTRIQQSMAANAWRIMGHRFGEYYPPTSM